MAIWPFKKKVDTLEKSGLMQGFTDWHSHILPGVDDGIPDMPTALQTLAEYERLGVKRVWLTPHIMEDFPNTTDALRQRFGELKEAYKGSIELNLAAENMLDSLFMERLEARDLLPIGKEGNYPVLDQPERYSYMNEADYKDLRRRGVLFQLNLLSVVGGYGETARGKAEWFLREGMAELAGSDVHRVSATLRKLAEAPRQKETLERLLALASSPKID